MRATVGEEVGTPDVSVDYDTVETNDEFITNLDFNFANLKNN